MPVNAMRRDLAEADRLLTYAKNLLGSQAYSCQWDNHYTLGEQIDDFIAANPDNLWYANFDPSPKRAKQRVIDRINADLAEDWTWD